MLLEALVEPHSDRIVLGGTANLTENALDFPAIRPVLEALEEQVVLLRLLDQSVATSQVVVRIGNETQHEGLIATSVVTSGYGAARIAASARSACSARAGWTTATPWHGWRPSPVMSVSLLAERSVDWVAGTHDS